jgi:hypothetical protein
MPATLPARNDHDGSARGRQRAAMKGDGQW